MAHCPKCGSTICVKDGFVKGRQRFRCKFCNYRHTVQYRGKSPETKRKAVELYLEGLGFRSIGRVLHCSNVTILNWIRELGERAEEMRSEPSPKVAEREEIRSEPSPKVAEREEIRSEPSPKVAVIEKIRSDSSTTVAEIEEIRSDSPLKVVEIDEMHTYISSKKTTVGYGSLLIDMENDSSTACLAIGAPRRGSNYGTRFKIRKSIK